jgi:hypothetical protein
MLDMLFWNLTEKLVFWVPKQRFVNKYIIVGCDYSKDSAAGKQYIQN